MKTQVFLTNMFDLDELVFSAIAEKNLLHEQWIVSASIVNCLANLCIYVLDRMKEKFPDMVITSGYRCRTLNAWVKGVVSSQHMRGEAVDVTHSDLDALWEFVKELTVDQAIRYNTFIHVSFKLGYNRNQYIDRRSIQELTSYAQD